MVPASRGRAEPKPPLTVVPGNNLQVTGPRRELERVGRFYFSDNKIFIYKTMALRPVRN